MIKQIKKWFAYHRTRRYLKKGGYLVSTFKINPMFNISDIQTVATKSRVEMEKKFNLFLECKIEVDTFGDDFLNDFLTVKITFWYEKR